VGGEEEGERLAVRRLHPRRRPDGSPKLPSPPSFSGHPIVHLLIFRLDVRLNLLPSLASLRLLSSTSAQLTVLFVNRVKREAAQQNPQKYVLDDQELQRVSALARIELEDAKAELQRAQKAANAIEKRVVAGVDEDADDDGDDGAWVE